MDGDGCQDQVVGDPQVRRGRGKLSLQPGQESEKRGSLRGLRAKAGLCPALELPTLPAVSGTRRNAMLGLPCVWVQGELGGVAGMQDRTPQTPVARRLPSRPARSPLPPGFYALKYLHNSVFSLKYICKNTFYRHHNENAISLVGNRSTVTQNNGITVWSDPIAD